MNTLIQYSILYIAYIYIYVYNAHTYLLYARVYPYNKLPRDGDNSDCGKSVGTYIIKRLNKQQQCNENNNNCNEQRMGKLDVGII